MSEENGRSLTNRLETEGNLSYSYDDDSQSANPRFEVHPQSVVLDKEISSIEMLSTFESVLRILSSDD